MVKNNEKRKEKDILFCLSEVFFFHFSFLIIYLLFKWRFVAW